MIDFGHRAEVGKSVRHLDDIREFFEVVYKIEDACSCLRSVFESLRID